MLSLQRGVAGSLTRAQISRPILNASSGEIWTRRSTGQRCRTYADDANSNSNSNSNSDDKPKSKPTPLVGDYRTILAKASQIPAASLLRSSTDPNSTSTSSDDPLLQPPRGTSRLNALPTRPNQKLWQTRQKEGSFLGLPKVEQFFEKKEDEADYQHGPSIFGGFGSRTPFGATTALLRKEASGNLAMDVGIDDAPQYTLHVHARAKNCIMTLVNEKSQMIAGVSSGSCGFKNSAEGTYEAGYQCAVKMFEVIRKQVEGKTDSALKVEISMKGFGQGRTALLKALSMSEGDGVRELVNKLTDKTPIKIGGVRLKKRRRL